MDAAFGIEKGGFHISTTPQSQTTVNPKPTTLRFFFHSSFSSVFSALVPYLLRPQAGPLIAIRHGWCGLSL